MLAGLIRFSITQKLIVGLITFALLVGGIWAYMRLPIEAFPDVLNEFVQVITLAPGQSAEDVEKKITAPLEREFAGIPKLIQKRSISEFGLSVVYLYFDDNVDKYWARTQVLEKIGTADLPAGTQPTLAPMAAVTGEVLRYQLKGSGYSETKLRSIQDWIVEKEFKVLPGVADVTGYGGKVLTWEVDADPLKLATYGISIRQLGDAVGNANSNGGGNFIHWPTQSFIVRSDGEIHKLADIENTSISQKNSSIIRVKDVAKVSESYAPQRGVVGRDEHDQIVQGIVLLRKGENPILV
ncbi:MAG: efflux RND transporter permease subunit, partial [Bdellovibrionota bacterium]